MCSYRTLQKEICKDLLQVDEPLQILLNVLQSVCELGGNFMQSSYTTPSVLQKLCVRASEV